MPGVTNVQVMQELKEIRDLAADTNTRIALLQQDLASTTELAKKHERLLYRSNGDPGLIDRVEDIDSCLSKHVEATEKKDKENAEMEKQKREDRRDEFTWLRRLLLGTLIAVGIDLLIHLPVLENVFN